MRTIINWFEKYIVIIILTCILLLSLLVLSLTLTVSHLLQLDYELVHETRLTEVTEVLPTVVLTIDSQEVKALAQTLYGEANGVTDVDNQKAVLWCIFNRVDSDEFPDTIMEVITAPNQFHGYSKYHPVTDELMEITINELTNYMLAKNRVLPQEYIYFHGNTDINLFRTTYKHTNDYWKEPLN